MNALARYLAGFDDEPQSGLPRLIATLMHREITELAARCARLPRPAELAAAALLLPSELDTGRLARIMRRELAIDIDSDTARAVVAMLAGTGPSVPLPASLDRLGAVIAEELRLPAACRAARDATARWDGAGALLRALAPTFGDEAIAAVEPPRVRDADLLLQWRDNDALVRRIVERLRATRRRPRRTDIKKPTGYRLGERLADVAPCELALLADAATEDLFMRRAAEHRLTVVDRRSPEPDPDPVVLLVDTSGSMEGEPELFAKALALALVQRLVPQGRRVDIVQFSGARDHSELRADAAGLPALLAFLARSFHGSTDFDSALELGLERAADVVLVTDGKGEVGPPVAERARRANVQVVLADQCRTAAALRSSTDHSLSGSASAIRRANAAPRSAHL